MDKYFNLRNLLEEHWEITKAIDSFKHTQVLYIETASDYIDLKKIKINTGEIASDISKHLKIRLNEIERTLGEMGIKPEKEEF